jgi:3'(2'), 5'-bisphosphate nucleotidase
MDLSEISVDSLIDISIEAGKRVDEIYNSNKFKVDVKEDNSPLTIADTESHRIIKQRLEKSFPHIPILSEEGKDIPYHQRKEWEYFWLVDPLDGTKEFISRNGEFTINIALIRTSKPVIGVIFAPILDTCYYSKESAGAFKMRGGNKPSKIKVDAGNRDGLIAVKSRSHSSEEEKKFLSQYDIKESISVGSSLKFCMIAEGKAHIYYRHGPTWEWDTAAGHAIAEHAGAFVSGLSYNKKLIKNSSFLVTSVGQS